MKRQKWLVVALAASAALNFAFVGAWAYHFFYVRPAVMERLPRGLQRAREWKGDWDKWAQERLNPDQRARMHAEQQALRSKLEQAAHRTRAAQDRFFELLAAPQPDQEALELIEGEIAAGQRQTRRLVCEHVLHLMKGLDAQQRRELAQMLRRRQGRSSIPGRGMGRRPMGGPHRIPERPGPREPERPHDAGSSPL